MAISFEEKRSSARTFFNNDEKIAAAINGHGGELFYVDILNISSGGLQLSQKRNGAISLQPGDHLTLMALNGLSELSGIKKVRMEVRWVIDQEFLDLISVGCQFHDMSPHDQGKIRLLVDKRANL